MNYQKLIDQLNKIFSPTDKSVKQLEQVIQKYAKQQQADLSYFLENDNLQLNANADPKDVALLLNELAEFKNTVENSEKDNQGISELCGIILNNLPYRTNADLCHLKSRLNLAKLGVNVNTLIKQKQAEIEQKTANTIFNNVPPNRVDELGQRLANFNSTKYPYYNKLFKQRALLRTSWQNATDDTPIKLVFKQMQRTMIDLDNIIDYKVQNSVNYHSMKKDYEKVLNTNQLQNLSEGNWQSDVAKRYMTTQADLQRIFITECKARQTQVAGKSYQLQGYQEEKIVSRHSSHVCRFCASLDGDTVKINEAVQGINVPPFHPNCCCNVIPVAMGYDDFFDDE